MTPREQRAASPRRRWVRWVVAIAAIVAVWIGVSAAYVIWASSGTGSGSEVRLVIPSGASAAEIAEDLAEHKVIRSPLLFRIVAQLRGVAGDLRAGEYVLRTGLSYSAAIEALRLGPAVRVTRVTIPEGKTISETAAIIEDATQIPARDLLAEVRGPRAIPLPGARPASLEGFLFPKTYDLLEDATAADVVAVLLQQFERETAGLDWSRAAALNLTPYEIVVAASLIERETRVPSERPVVAAVIYNRLRKGMRLQIDATVQYAIFVETGSYKSRLLFKDLEIDSPYNTYRVDGLPPGPIASPGRASIEAALAPADVDYLYYVLTGDKGEHSFATTYEEFLRLKAKAGGG